MPKLWFCPVNYRNQWYPVALEESLISDFMKDEAYVNRVICEWRCEELNKIERERYLTRLEEMT